MNVAASDSTQYLDEACNKIEGFEGRVPWFYLDEFGNVTVGVGRMLPNVAEAQALPFQLNDMPARLDQVAEDYERVKAMVPNHLPTFYLSSQSVKLGEGDIDALLYSVVVDVDRRLRQSFLHYLSWPKSAKLATIDMLYNLGGRNFMLYKHLIRALMAEDWTTAAKESGRNIEDAAFAARNYWTRVCYLDAEVEATTAAAATAATQQAS